MAKLLLHTARKPKRTRIFKIIKSCKIYEKSKYVTPEYSSRIWCSICKRTYSIQCIDATSKWLAMIDYHNFNYVQNAGLTVMFALIRCRNKTRHAQTQSRWMWMKSNILLFLYFHMNACTHLCLLFSPCFRRVSILSPPTDKTDTSWKGTCMWRPWDRAARLNATGRGAELRRKSEIKVHCNFSPTVLEVFLCTASIGPFWARNLAAELQLSALMRQCDMCCPTYSKMLHGSMSHMRPTFFS